MSYMLALDDAIEDLPRTLRREKEARARAQLEEADTLRALKAEKDEKDAPAWHGDFGSATAETASASFDAATAPPVPASVKHLDVPFFQLMAFWLKAVVAGIPALMLLGAILWGAGHLMQTYLPWLVKMQIFIHFPS